MNDRIWEYTKEPPTIKIEVEALDEGEALSDWVDGQVRQALKEFVRDGLYLRKVDGKLEVQLLDSIYEPIITMEADWDRFMKTEWLNWMDGEPDYNDDPDEEGEE